jgi:hypothetical protein
MRHFTDGQFVIIGKLLQAGPAPAKFPVFRDNIDPR